jgi:hypothetical protein
VLRVGLVKPVLRAVGLEPTPPVAQPVEARRVAELEPPTVWQLRLTLLPRVRVVLRAVRWLATVQLLQVEPLAPVVARRSPVVLPVVLRMLRRAGVSRETLGAVEVLMVAGVLGLGGMSPVRRRLLGLGRLWERLRLVFPLRVAGVVLLDLWGWRIFGGCGRRCSMR